MHASVPRELASNNGHRHDVPIAHRRRRDHGEIQAVHKAPALHDAVEYGTDAKVSAQYQTLPAQPITSASAVTGELRRERCDGLDARGVEVRSHGVGGLSPTVSSPPGPQPPLPAEPASHPFFCAQQVAGDETRP